MVHAPATLGFSDKKRRMCGEIYSPNNPRHGSASDKRIMTCEQNSPSIHSHSHRPVTSCGGRTALQSQEDVNAIVVREGCWRWAGSGTYRQSVAASLSTADPVQRRDARERQRYQASLEVFHCRGGEIPAPSLGVR